MTDDRMPEVRAGARHGRVLVALAILLPLLVHGALFLGGLTVANHGRLLDPDGYLRAVRVVELADTGVWFSDRVPRVNAPYGTTLPWSRPMDALLLAGAWAGSFVTEFRDAVFWSSALSGPVLEVAVIALIAWYARALVAPGTILLAGALLLIQPGPHNFFQIGRGDHHGLQALLLVALIAALIRGLGRPDDRRWRYGAGLIAALALWVSVEALLAVLAALVGLGLLWLRDGGPRARDLADFCAAFAVGTMLALAGERPLADWPRIDYDKNSIVHVTLALLMALATQAVAFLDRRGGPATWRRRLGLGALAALLVAGAMAVPFPGFFRGPFGNLAPEIDALLMADIAELRPLWPVDGVSTARFLMHLGPLAVALPFAAWRVVRGQGVARDAYLLLFVALAVYAPFALTHVRVAPFAETLLVVPWAAAIAWVLAPLARRATGFADAALRSAVALAMLVWHVVAAVGAAHGERLPATVDPCPWDRLAEVLVAEQPAPGRKIVLTQIYPGSELLWRTDYDVVSAPYHDDRAGIEDTFKVLTAPTDAAALEPIARRGIGVIALCRKSLYIGKGVWASVTASPDTLFERLMRGDAPPWLAPVPLPPDIADTFVVYEWAGSD